MKSVLSTCYVIHAIINGLLNHSLKVPRLHAYSAAFIKKFIQRLNLHTKFIFA